TAKDVPGLTNIILLDEKGDALFEATVSVSGSNIPGKVQIHPRGRQASIHTYWAFSCTLICVRVEDKFEISARESRYESETVTTREVPEVSSEPPTAPEQSTPRQ